MAVLTVERVERPPSLFDRTPQRVRRAPAAGGAVRERAGDPGGGPTLDDAIAGAWEGLAARVVAACPLCGGALRPHPAPDVVSGRCGDCGTALD